MKEKLKNKVENTVAKGECFEKSSAADDRVIPLYENSTADDFEHILSKNRKSL